MPGDGGRVGQRKFHACIEAVFAVRLNAQRGGDAVRGFKADALYILHKPVGIAGDDLPHVFAIPLIDFDGKGGGDAVTLQKDHRFALLSLLLVAFANVGTQGTGSYVNCMIVKSGMPKVSYRLMVLIAMVYVGALTVWGGVEEHFGAFISIAAFIQAPIIGMIVADYLLVRRRKLSLKAAYFMKGHDAYRYTGGFNLVGLACVVIACLTTILFVYNPLTGEIRSGLFLIFTGSGFDALFGGVLYWLASLTPLKKYMLRDRDDLEIV